MLETIAALARDAVTVAGYPGLLAAMVAENLFPPIPSEVVLPLAGYEAARGTLSFALVVAVATAGSVLGAFLLYLLGRGGGRYVVLRWGRVLRVTPRDLDRAEGWFERWGDWVVVGARVVPVARSIVSIPAGTMRMPVARFLVLTTIGSLAWNLLLVGAGYQLGANWKDVEGVVAPLSKVAVAAAGAGLVVAAAWWWRRRIVGARAVAASGEGPDDGGR